MYIFAVRFIHIFSEIGTGGCGASVVGADGCGGGGGGGGDGGGGDGDEDVFFMLFTEL